MVLTTDVKRLAKGKNGKSSNQILEEVYGAHKDLPGAAFDKVALMRRTCNRVVEKDRDKVLRRPIAEFEIDIERGFNFFGPFSLEVIWATDELGVTKRHLLTRLISTKNTWKS